MHSLAFVLPAFPIKSLNPRRRVRHWSCCTYSPHPQSTRTSYVAAVEAQFRSLDADAAADLAFTSLSKQAAPSLPAFDSNLVLHVFAEHEITGNVLSRIVQRLGVLQVLQLQADRVSNIVDFLDDSLGMTRAQRNRVIAQRPDLLDQEERIQETVNALQEVGMKSRDMRQVVQRWPGLLILEPRRIQRAVGFLCSPIVGFSNENVRSLLRRAPWVLVYDVDTDMVPAIQGLRSALDLPERLGVDYCIRASPLLLGTPRPVMREVVRFLSTEVGFDSKMVSAVVGSFPPILTCSVQKYLRPAARYLRDEVTLSSTDLVRVVRAFPAILTLDIDEDMRTVVNYFRSRGVINVERIVRRLPPILGFDLDTNIRPKMDFIEKELGLSAYDILRFPGFFSYSLEKCIKPRTKFLQARKKSVTGLGLNLVLASNNAEFCLKVAGVPLAQYEAFLYAHYSKKGRSKIDDADTKTGKNDSPRLSDSSSLSLDGTGFRSPDEVSRGLQKRRKRRFRATLSRMPWNELK